MFNENIGLMGVIDKNEGGLKEIYMLGSGDGSIVSGANIFLCMNAIIATVDPALSTEERTDILKKMGFLNKKIDFNNLSDTEKNDIKYTISYGETMGFLFGASKK